MRIFNTKTVEEWNDSKKELEKLDYDLYWHEDGKWETYGENTCLLIRTDYVTFASKEYCKKYYPEIKVMEGAYKNES